MSTLKKTLAVIIIGSLLYNSISVAASAPYSSYAYSYTDEGVIDVAAPQAYLPETIYEASDMGISLSSPEDLIVDSNGNFYICDAGMNKIEVLSPKMVSLRTISSFQNQGNEDSFNAPGGIFIDESNNLYIADTGNNRVVVLDGQDKLLRIIANPKSEVFAEDFVFTPLKVLVDSSRRIFVLCKNVYSGILQFSESGNFIGFVGSNKVVASPLMLLWKSVMTDVQKSKLESFVPVEYTNLALDYKGFIYAVTSVKNVDTPIRRLNPSGNDILVRSPLDGSKTVAGDVLYVSYGATGVLGPSAFMDITSDDKGNYYALDGKRGRVFTYDEDGNMLFVFGSLNSGQKGSFVSPTAIQYVNGSIYVLDRSLCQVIVFEPTEYALLIQDAMKAYIDQDFQQSVALWEELIKRNGNFDLAYLKAGYAFYRLQDYEKAMKYFKLINAKKSYSEAYIKNQKIFNNRYFNWIASGVIGLAVLLIAGSLLRMRKKRRSVTG